MPTVNTVFSVRRIKNGFTLIELICVVAIIGVLIGMLVPAVQQVRESARNVSCKNKIRQLALACDGYESAHGIFPAGTLGFFEPCILEFQQGMSVFEAPGSRFYFRNHQHTSWILQVLPWMEQEPLYESLPEICRNPNMSYSEYKASHPSAPIWLDGFSSVRDAASKELEAVLCPSDSINDVETGGELASVVGSQPVFIYPNDLDILHGRPISEFQFADLAATNYAGCTGAYSGGSLAGMNTPVARDMAKYRGIFRSRRSATFGDLTDGSSQTVLLGETIGLIRDRVRSAPTSWLFGGLARARSNLDWETGKAIAFPGLTVFGDAWYAWPSGFGSMHPSTTNFAFADSSVRSIARSIDFQVFKALCGCADGESVEP